MKKKDMKKRSSFCRTQTLHLIPWGVCQLTDLCDVCGCGGAGSFWSDGLSAQEYTRVKVAISVNLYKNKITQHATLKLQFTWHIWGSFTIY